MPPAEGTEDTYLCLPYPHTSEGRQQALKVKNGLVLLKLNLLSAAPKSHPHYNSVSVLQSWRNACKNITESLYVISPTFSAEDEVASDIFDFLSSTR